MRTVTINRNSWHYKLVLLVNGVPGDICGYIRSMVYCATFILCVVFLACLMSIPLGNAFAFLAFLVLNGYLPPINGLEVIGLFLMSCGVVIAVWLLKERYMPERRVIPSFVSAAMESIGDKMCFRVNYR